MATKTCTAGANQIAFEDPTGIRHVVTTSQTFTFELTDGGASAVTYQQNNATSVTTTDGRRLTFRPQASNATNGTGNGNLARTWGPTADAQDGVAVRNLAGEFVAEFSEGNLPQFWKSTSMTVDNVDSPTVITARFEDQDGRVMVWTALDVS